MDANTKLAALVEELLREIKLLRQDFINTERKIPRNPVVDRLDGVNTTKSTPIQGCIDFTVQNWGAERIYVGFKKNQKPDIVIEPGEFIPFPLYRRNEYWQGDGDVYIRFGQNGSNVTIVKTI